MRSVAMMTVLTAAGVAAVVMAADTPGQKLLGSGIIPAERLADWRVGVTVGVPGGIPTDRKKLIDVTKEPYKADNTGATDASAAIQQAMKDAKEKEVVYLPAGTYRINSGLGLKSHVTLRGAGMDKTVLMLYNAASVAANGNYGTLHSAGGDVITGGLEKGSTKITLASTAAYSVGQEIEIGAKNPTTVPMKPSDPVVVGVGGFDYLRQQKGIVTAKTDTTLTFQPPLYIDYTKTPCRLLAATPLVGVGVEDLAIDAVNSTTPFVLKFSDNYGSWVKNVKVGNARNYTITMDDCIQCEIRHSWLDKQNRGSGSNGAGFLCEFSTGILFEDNIIGTSYPSIEVNFGTIGSVFAYNFLKNDDPTTQGIDMNHGPHNQLNLYEGNIIPNSMSDGYFGSNSSETIFRNWYRGVSGDQPTYTLALKRFSRNFSIVGNIFQDPNYKFSGKGLSLGQPNIGNSSDNGSTAPPWPDWGKKPGPGGFQEMDGGVLKTAIIKDNFWYFDKTIDRPLPAGQRLPDSMYHRTKPAWFGDLKWPPFDPARPNPSFEAIPAGYRYVHNGKGPLTRQD